MGGGLPATVGVETGGVLLHHHHEYTLGMGGRRAGGLGGLGGLGMTSTKNAALIWVFSPKIWGKSAQKLLDLVKPPPPFLPKIPKLLVHKKCPKTFGSARNPPPLMEKTK